MRLGFTAISPREIQNRRAQLEDGRRRAIEFIRQKTEPRMKLEIDLRCSENPPYAAEVLSVNAAALIALLRQQLALGTINSNQSGTSDFLIPGRD